MEIITSYERKGIEIGEKRGIKIGEKRGEQRGIKIGEQRGKQKAAAELICLLLNRNLVRFLFGCKNRLRSYHSGN